MRGQKRKSEIAPSASNDSEQPVTGRKKAKQTQSTEFTADPSDPSQCPAPRLTSRVLKAQLATSGRKPVSSSVVAEEQAATRKRPAEGEVVDESVPGFPSKKIKGTNPNANKPQTLRRTGLFSHIRIGNKMLKMF